LAVLERAAITNGYTGDQAVGDTLATGFRAFCEAIGISRKAIERSRQTGEIDLWVADRIAVALKLHPLIIWPVEYDAWLDVGEFWQDPDEPGPRLCSRCGTNNRYDDGHCKWCKQRRESAA
jgi:hypothetical protein